MKTLLFIFTVFYLSIGTAGGQNYLIDFAVSSSIPLNIVKVDNLSTGESVTINGTDVLNLKGNSVITGIIDKNASPPGIKIYPNPMTDKAILEIQPPVPGNAVITILDLSGKIIISIKDYLDNSLQVFKFSGETSRGIYIVNVRSNQYQLSGKLISNGSSSGLAGIEKISGSRTTQATDIKASAGKKSGRITEMLYTQGDKLKFTAMSGDYQTVLTDIPDKNKTIIFDIDPNRDGDGNNYNMVEIDGRYWAEENLKTTKYTNGTSLPLVADSVSWSNLTKPGFCWYNNNEAAYKNPFGALYNSYVIREGNVCPAGWHISTDAEWTSLKDFLSVNGYAFGTNNNAIGKSIASTSKWNVYTYVYELRGPMETIGAVGKDQETTNNSTGFNGYPGGMRSSNGSFNQLGAMGVWFSDDAIALQPDGGLWDWSLSYQNPDIQQGSDEKNSGFSVRCVKD
jgi:uncharacterized protein (TIGR02145 family)